MAAKFFFNLIVVSVATVLVVVFITVILFLNLAKVKLFKLVVGYTLSSVFLLVPTFFGLVVLVALAKTAYDFLRNRVSMVVFSLGISPRVYLGIFSLFGVVFFLLSLLYFQVGYPEANFFQHITYLESKKKAVRRGIVQNFWLKRGNLFLNIDLINLDTGKAYGGEIFKVNDRFRLISVVPFAVADFKIVGGKLVLSVNDAEEFTPNGVKVIGTVKMAFPYDVELLKARKPKFFPLVDLFRLLFISKNLGINTTPFVWELEKRILISLLLLWIFLYGGINFFKSVSGGEIVRKVATASVLTVLFYVFLFIYQSLVDKISLNPYWFLLIVLPYGFLVVKDLKGEW